MTFILPFIAALLLAAHAAAAPFGTGFDGLTFQPYPASRLARAGPLTRAGVPQSSLPTPQLLVQHARTPWAARAGETPLHIWYTPTFKCSDGYYCTAELVSYAEFEGGHALQVGYSISSFAAPSMPIIPDDITRIKHTTQQEIMGYTDVLLPHMMDTFPQTCRASVAAIDNAFMEAIQSYGSACHETREYQCEHRVTVTRC